jgi:3-hydroxybutyryl-CoA dehydrogenase
MSSLDCERAVVIGAGTMGAGITQVLLFSGVTVSLVDPSPAALDTARSRIAAGLRKQAERDPAGSSEPQDALMSRLTVVSALPPEERPALVIEAVPESPALKSQVLAAADAAYPGASLVASNTSSLSITELAQCMHDDGRFLGMHFFNPVPRSELVELVVGPATAPSAVQAARSWAGRIGKRSIVVRDSPGFATSRLGLVIGLEAIRMVEAGVASAEDVDLGMVLGYKFPVGPLRLTDIVGLDVRLAIAEHLHAALGPRFEPPALLRAKVAAGELGQKSGRGFYDWTSAKSPTEVSRSTYGNIA